MIDLDDLIERLRTRIADPARRVDIQARTFDREVATMDIGALFSTGRSLAGDLLRVVEANQAGQALPSGMARTVDALAAAMAEPAPPSLRPPASEAMLRASEEGIGAPLPVEVRRVYGEVADGGFGPASGLLPLADAVAAYHAYRIDPPMSPPGQVWPVGLLPLIRYDIGVDAVEVLSGRMVAWDPETLTERSGATAWLRTFGELAASFDSWLDAWERAPTPGERLRDTTQASIVEQARAARATIAAMSPAERAAIGLPEHGWEREVWGGIGLDDD